jgi:hypothetical protein
MSKVPWKGTQKKYKPSEKIYEDFFCFEFICSVMKSIRIRTIAAKIL